VFCAEIDKISQNLAGMAEDARDILELRRLAEGGSANDGFLPRLQRSVGEALALVGEIEAADRGAAEVGAAAQATAAQLADRVATIRTIKSEIQQMALNANLKCGRMGDAGKPLSVIAVEMRAYASRLDETAEDTEAALEGLARVRSAGPAEAVIAQADIGAVLQGAVARIGQAGEAAGADLAGLAAQGETIAATLSRLSSRLNLRAEVGEVMARTGEALAIEAGPPEACDAAVAEVLDPLLDKVSGLYTMAREREIHKAFAATCAPPALAVA
jgi:methyl-accepting chemotaxis protein